MEVKILSIFYFKVTYPSLFLPKRIQIKELTENNSDLIFCCYVFQIHENKA